MQENKVKQALRENRLALGTYVTFADPQIIEIIGLAGYDAAFIDMEHTTFDLTLVSEMIRAADVVGVTSMIRVPATTSTSSSACWTPEPTESSSRTSMALKGRNRR